MSTKTCTGCKAEKPFSDFYTAATPTGRRSRCISCMKAYAESKKDHKKAYDEKYRVRGYVKQRQWDARRRPEKRASKFAYDRRYYALKSEHKKAWFKEYYRKNAEQRREYSRRFVRENPEWHAAYKQKYYEEHKFELYVRAAARRAFTKRATPLWANKKAMAAVYARAAFMTEMFGEQYVVDHIVPITSPVVCGLHVEHNLRVIPWRENTLKSNRLIEELL